MSITITSLRFTACMALVTALATTDAAALDLVASYEQALYYDPSMLAADQAVLAGREKTVQGAALLKPQVSLIVGASRVDSHIDSDLPPAFDELVKKHGAGTVHQLGVQLVQPLYNQRAAADARQLRERGDLAEVRHHDARQELVQRVGEAYFSLLLAQENLRVVQAEKAAVENQRDRAQARYDVGRSRITDVYETQARYDNVLAREVSAVAALELREAQYRELTGVAPQTLAPLREQFLPQPPDPDTLTAWEEKALDGNTRVMTRRGELAIAEAEIAKYKLSGRPSVELVASYVSKGQNGSLSAVESPAGSYITTIGVQLKVPLYAGGALQSQHRESLAKRNEAELQLSAARRDARLQVHDAFLSVKTGVARVSALEQSVRSAQVALEATTLGRDVGNRTELDVLDAQQHLYSVQRDLAQARTDYLLGRIRLASSVGELGEATLSALNAYLAH